MLWIMNAHLAAKGTWELQMTLGRGVSLVWQHSGMVVPAPHPGLLCVTHEMKPSATCGMFGKPQHKDHAKLSSGQVRRETIAGDGMAGHAQHSKCHVKQPAAMPGCSTG